jgi:hypothetical protein
MSEKLFKLLKQIKFRVLFMFSEDENKIYEIAFTTFSPRLHALDVLGSPKWKSTGIEHWVQTELIVAMVDNGLNITTIGKVRNNCDLLVKNKADCIRLEIEAVTNFGKSYIPKSHIEKHMSQNIKPSMFLFLGRLDATKKGEFFSYLEKNGYIEKHESLSKDWMLMIFKKDT